MSASRITLTGPLPTLGWSHTDTWKKSSENTMDTCRLCLKSFTENDAFRSQSAVKTKPESVHLSCLTKKWHDEHKASDTIPSTTNLNSKWVTRSRKSLEEIILGKVARVPIKQSVRTENTPMSETALVDSSTCFRCGVDFVPGDDYCTWSVNVCSSSSKVNVHSMTKSRAGCHIGSTGKSQAPIHRTTARAATELKSKKIFTPSKAQSATSAGAADSARDDVPESWDDEEEEESQVDPPRGSTEDHDDSPEGVVKKRRKKGKKKKKQTTETETDTTQTPTIAYDWR